MLGEIRRLVLTLTTNSSVNAQPSTQRAGSAKNAKNNVPLEIQRYSGIIRGTLIQVFQK